ncbi:hypothetical protein L210DRAFT_3417312 [Boletus edulis BED1]|uniref:Ubiquitin-like protease family profile domain-containing protein n=1 Tax=Boletus edulis BED1 TaxID=1328754 RepID=A0AAD4BH11_BOLED|nr:hypothetical protein L210DRAFT_3417312 [Boletus edulis BED1]
MEHEGQPDVLTSHNGHSAVQCKRRILPDLRAQRLCSSWRAVIPTVIAPYLSYASRTLGKPLPPTTGSFSLCNRENCTQKSTNILCLLFDRNFFPTTPSQPRMVVSVELLTFYRALFERSCDAVNALASALHTYYVCRGYQMVDKNNEAIQEPFRRSLGFAVQWYDILQVEVERDIEAAIQRCRDVIRDAKTSAATVAPSMPQTLLPTRRNTHSLLATPSTPLSRSSTPLAPGRCDPILIQRCPACFAGTTFGRSLAEGGDIHVATDGNFHHRHRRSAGDCPPFYDPVYFLPKSQVDAMGCHIQAQRKKSPKVCKPLVPDEALDSCEASYEAADGKKQKTCMESFDDTGIMALICRHDIPLFFANIDSPGEQQKYSLALISHLFSLVPSNATVTTLYDVGCTLDRTLSLYDILSSNVVSWLRFATTAMHAYGHGWACQLVYNPRLSEGLGLSDGEGNERLWSRLIKLIGIERSSSRQRRIWLIDRQAAAIGAEMRMDLGNWIKRCLQRGIHDQGKVASDNLDECGIPVEELRLQWASQKESQLSIRAHAPARLKKELDTVLGLQADIDVTNQAVQSAKITIEKHSISDDTMEALSSLERTHDRLMNKVEALYTSLNVSDKFPELQDVDLDFVRTLLLARDLKINIRKRAIGSFFEWDKLDQAVGGAQKALGTRLHQRTRKAIAKRQPALMAAIRKYNGYCTQLEELHDATWFIPLPKPLPTKLNELRNHESLMEDVWITPSIGEIPRWMNDQVVRGGIRAMLKRDRCVEEQQRLGMEADNLCRWYGNELAAVELALRLPEKLLTLPLRWSSPLALKSRFDVHTQEAAVLAFKLTGDAPQTSPSWITPTIIEVPEVSAEEQQTTLQADVRTEVTLDSEDLITLDYVVDESAADDHDEDEPSNERVISAKIHFTVDPTPVPPQSAAHVDGTHGVRRRTFDTEDIGMLASPTSHVNDVCINGCIPLLFSAIDRSQARQFAVFSTFDLPLALHKTDQELFQATKHTNFWTKDTWIFPIYRPGHWVLCVADFTRCELRLFDSLAEEQPWRSDVTEIVNFMSRLLSVVNTTFPEVHMDSCPWIAHPITTTPLQTNGFDCGIWVLATILATFRGYSATCWTEKDITVFRHYLYVFVQSSLVD